MSRFQTTVQLLGSRAFSTLSSITSRARLLSTVRPTPPAGPCLAVSLWVSSHSKGLASAHPTAAAVRTTLTDFHTTNSADLVRAWRLLWARPPGRRAAAAVGPPPLRAAPPHQIAPGSLQPPPLPHTQRGIVRTTDRASSAGGLSACDSKSEAFARHRSSNLRCSELRHTILCTLHGSFLIVA